MKILTVHNFYQQPGGEDVVWRNEAALLRSKGHRVAEFVRRNDHIRSRNLLASARLALRTVWCRETMRELSDVLARERPDLVHFHNTFPLISPSAYYACRDSGIPVVQTLHNYRLLCPAATFFRDGRICEECVEHSLWHSIRHSCYRDSRSATAATAAMLSVHRALHTWSDTVDRFIVPAEFCREKLSDGGIPRRKLVVKPNFLAPDPGCRAGVGGDYALFVGRLTPEKGVRTLIDAWTRFLPKFRLRILGDGPLRHLVDCASSSVGSDRIEFGGWTGSNHVVAAIKGASFLVLPSEWYETFGLAAVEAFACGVPVIASRLGVMAELVKDGCTGLHFTPADPQDLAAKASWAFEHPRRLEEMGHNARAEFEAKYTAERNYPQLIAIYESVLAARPHSTASEYIYRPGGQDAVQSRPEARFS